MKTCKDSSANLLASAVSLALLVMVTTAAAEEAGVAMPQNKETVAEKKPDKNEAARADNPVMEEMVVWGEQKKSEQAGYTSPVSTIKQEDLKSINMATTEDSVKYEPSIVIRRRFIGDSNGTLGLRGSNMFQTSRSMVFADGVPLHYLLQSRWNAAPRWSMVSASEIEQVDVVYGPYSAEYSGNAMGGAVLIETKIPQKQELRVENMIFRQDFEAYGFDDSLDGRKSFMSYSDKTGNTSLYFSYNHLDNEAQPQSYIFNTYAAGTATPDVSGGIIGNDSQSRSRMFYGDTGVVHTTTDNYKIKLGYDFGNWFGLLNLAYEDRHSANTGNSYIRDTSGNTVWQGTVNQDGQDFDISASSLGASELYRDSLNTGLRLKGDLSDTTHMEVNLSSFDVLKDENRTSSANPNDPLFDGGGRITDYDDTGWTTAEAKWTLDSLGSDKLSMVTGLRHESYRLNIAVYDSNNYFEGDKAALRDSSGGESSINAAFAQFNWEFANNWDTSMGLRYESWKSSNGYYDNDPTPATTDLVYTPSRSEKRTSPKFSLGYKPGGGWITRYSVANAYRFPIVEEMYSQYEAYAAKSLANPDLEPEDGLHHNLMFERGLGNGYMRINLYRENIKDVIESQSTILPGGGSIRTFIPVDEVQTSGIEFIVNARKLLLDALDVRFNVAYTDSEIVQNDADPDLEGNVFPRMPEWRSNLMATYHVNSKWDINGNVQYASDSYGRLDNTDDEDNVYGAQDGYTRIGLKTNYQFSQNANIALGVDNLTDEVAYVAHPWPGRTWYLTLSYGI